MINEEKHSKQCSIEEKLHELYKLKKNGEISVERYLLENEILRRRQLQMDPDNIYRKQSLARTLWMKVEHLGNQEGVTRVESDREQCFREMIELDPENIKYKEEFAKLLLTKLHRFENREREEQEAILDEIIQYLIGETQHRGIILSAYFITNDHAFQKVENLDMLSVLEEFSRKILVLDPQYDRFRNLLTRVLLNKADRLLSYPLEKGQQEEWLNRRIGLWQDIVSFNPEEKSYQENYEKALLEKIDLIKRERAGDPAEQTRSLEQSYKSLIKIFPKKREYILALEEILLQKADDLDRMDEEGRKEKLLRSKEKLYRDLVSLRPDVGYYRRELAETLIQLGDDLKRGKQNLDEAERLFREAAQLSNERQKAKTLYHLGLLAIQQKEWETAYTHLNEALSKGHIIYGTDLIFDLCWPYVICCAHLNKGEEAYLLLEQVKELDQDRKFFKELHFVELYLSMMTGIKFFRLIERGGKTRNIDFSEGETLVLACEQDEYDSNEKVVLDLRSPDQSRFVGPNDSIKIEEREALLLQILITNVRPVSAEEIQSTLKEEGIDTNLNTLYNAFLRLKRKIKNCFMDQNVNEIITSIRNTGYSWNFSGDTYIIERTDIKPVI